jgi:hypothetical protein
MLSFSIVWGRIDMKSFVFRSDLTLHLQLWIEETAVIFKDKAFSCLPAPTVLKTKSFHIYPDIQKWKEKCRIFIFIYPAPWANINNV